MEYNEMTQLIYDTLMQNVGISKHHKEFDLSLVDDQECHIGFFEFDYGDNRFRITIDEVEL